MSFVERCREGLFSNAVMRKSREERAFENQVEMNAVRGENKLNPSLKPWRRPAESDVIAAEKKILAQSSKTAKGQRQTVT